MTEMIQELLTSPLFFEKNRVGRVYTGGALFADFFGDDSTDGYEPEEWVVSSVTALNKESKGEKEGVSRVRGTDLWWDDLLRNHAETLLGPGRTEFGILTKVLDSAIRLPVQAHPDKAFSRAHFNSEYGKAEAWVVLGCREDACLYFGFNRAYTPEEFRAAVAKSEHDRDAMERLLNRVPVTPGDVFFVNARMVHAIGKGCLILEIQEPTDFTIQPEYYCGDYRLNEQEMYVGLAPETALSVFDFSTYGEAAVAAGRKTPRVLFCENGVTAEALITAEDTPCFTTHRYTVSGTAWTLAHRPAVYVVTAGNGVLRWDSKQTAVKQGDYFFLPYGAAETALQSDTSVTVVAAF